MLFLTIIDDDIIRNHLETMFILYSKELVYASHSILNDLYEAEDVVQSALIKISNHIDENTDIKSRKTKGLLVLIVRRLSYNIYNQRKCRNEISIDTIDQSLFDNNLFNPELNILRSEDRKKISSIMNKLNSSYIDILTLKYTYDYTDCEIANLLNISEGNVRTKLSRARKAFQQVLGGDLND